MPVAVFRLDAGPTIGAGHLIRCQALAQCLEDAGWQIHLAGRREGFAMLPLPPWPRLSLEDLDAAGESRALLTAFPDGVDLLVVDHYHRNAVFERACRPWARRILVIDDLGDRPHDCDWLLDATPHRQSKAYADLVPQDCRLLLGGEYALLRSGFARARWRRRPSTGPVQTLLVALGSTDPGRYLPMVLRAIVESGYTGRTVVTLAPAAPHYAEVADILAAMNGAILAPDADIPTVLAESDLAVGAGGVGLLERACLGLPSLLLCVAANQRDNLAAVEAVGAAMVVPELQQSLIAHTLRQLLADAVLRSRLAQRNAMLCDGLGIWRTWLALESDTIRLRKAVAGDAPLLLEWQQHPATRRFARDPEPPDPVQHRTWYAGKLADTGCLFHILEEAGQPAGLVRLDWRADRQGFEVSIAIDPARHGRGLGGMALGLIRRLVPGEDLWAYVKPENASSLRMFAKAGYTATRDTDWYLSREGAV